MENTVILSLEEYNKILEINKKLEKEIKKANDGFGFKFIFPKGITFYKSKEELEKELLNDIEKIQKDNYKLDKENAKLKEQNIELKKDYMKTRIFTILLIMNTLVFALAILFDK